MFKFFGALALSTAIVAPAHAATTIIFTPNSSVIPEYTTATVFQNFNTANPNGTTYVPVVGESTTGSVRTFRTNAAGQAIGPAVAPPTGSFLAVGRSGQAGSYSVALTGAQVFSFVFGGLGASDRIVLNFVGGATQTLNGIQICGGAATSGCALLATGRVTYDLGGTAVFNRATFSSPTAAFEIDALASAAPEPATWLMMILGFGLVGGQLRRRKGQRTLGIA